MAEKHTGKRLCITGIPTAGKSTLAKRLADETDGLAISFDDFREKLAGNAIYEPWTNFYISKDPVTYYTTTSPEDQWRYLVAQSEGLWPAFKEEIQRYQHEERPVIFECVNLLPHLVVRDLGFNCIVLLGTSYEETLRRNQFEPRWSNDSKVIELNAKSFFYIERPHYLEEAQKYNCPVFETGEDAYETALAILQ